MVGNVLIIEGFKITFGLFNHMQFGWVGVELFLLKIIRTYGWKCAHNRRNGFLRFYGSFGLKL